MSTKRPRTTGLLLLVLGFGFAAPALPEDRNPSAGVSGAQARDCQALYVQKLRLAREALARHESEHAIDYLVGAKEILSACMKDVRGPANPQGQERNAPHVLSELHPAVDMRQSSYTTRSS